MPEIVKLVSEQCKTTDDIKRLIQQGIIPSVITGNGEKVDIDSLNNSNSGSQFGLISNKIVFFDPRNKLINKKNNGVRLITWISSQSDKEALSEVEVFLPRPFTTKYVTAAFIES